MYCSPVYYLPPHRQPQQHPGGGAGQGGGAGEGGGGAGQAGGAGQEETKKGGTKRLKEKR